MPSSDTVRRIQRSYPQVYGACHVRHVRAATNEHRVSARDSALLAHLDDRRPVRAAALAAHLGVRPSTLSAALERLERLGYVRRAKTPQDRRALDLTLGPRGLAALAGTSVLDGERVDAVLGRLTPAEQRRAADGLDLLARASRELMLEAGLARARARGAAQRGGAERPRDFSPAREGGPGGARSARSRGKPSGSREIRSTSRSDRRR